MTRRAGGPVRGRHLDPEARERSLDTLGVRERGPFLEGEMLRLFGALAATLGHTADREAGLRVAIAAAMSEYD